MKTTIGIAFGEHVYRQEFHQQKNNRFDSSTPAKKTRGILLLAALFLVVLLLFGKLLFVQLFEGAYFKKLSDSNRIRTNVVHAPRGVIFDSFGVPLVYNTPGFRQVAGVKTSVLTREEALNKIARGQKNIEVDSLRFYPQKDIFSHVLGFIGQISEDELKNPQFAKYNGTDLVGKMGIERFYESTLKGTDGKELVEVDAMGKVIQTLGKTDPTPGQNITLTIDSKLQQAAYGALYGVKKGVVIVSNPKGEMLALVSAPSFDPNLFTMGDHYRASDGATYKHVSDILEDNTNQPLLNRAISGTYPPGSTFKIVTAAAGLGSGSIDEHYSVEDTGVLKIGEFSFANWYFTQYGRTEGSVDIVKALKRSNDIFFYELAEKVGATKLSSFAKQFGLGGRLGIDLDGEAKGLVPDPTWKKNVIGESWYLGDTYHYGIGQGFLLTTPLQVNAWTQAIANEGALYTPHLLMNKESIMNKDFLSQKTVSLIREGMIESCSTGGVAWPLFEFRIQNSKFKIDGKNFLEPKVATNSASSEQAGSKDSVGVSIACKTGTAQHGGETTLPHAWITLFAPAYNPQIIVTVLVESSGEGSNIAAPIAKKVLEAWFSN